MNTDHNYITHACCRMFHLLCKDSLACVPSCLCISPVDNVEPDESFS